MPSPSDDDDFEPHRRPSASASGANKRRADGLQPDIIVKRRASRACLICRRRKELDQQCPSPASADSQGHPLPSYIRCLPAHLKPIDLEYLAKKGALTMPDDELQRELFRKYIQYVHPFMPVLDLAAFLSPIVRRDGTSQVSLLVLQAVMFTGVALVDLDYLTARGYSNRRSARREFFERVRLLYDLECEPNRISRLQALLLMTYWYERPEDEKETWYWTGITQSLANVMGMHRNPDHMDISQAMKRLRKRIWWSCFVRDRLLALGIRRPARIRSEDFDVPMLTLDDCEMAPFEDDILRYFGPLPVADDAAIKRSISLCFVELAQLCVHIGDTLFTQYSILGSSTGWTEDTITMMVRPKRSTDQMQDMEKCDSELSGWLQNLSPACRYQLSPHQVEEQQHQQPESKTILRFHQALLYIIYLATMTILHRPHALQVSANTSADILVNSRLSTEKVTEAAAEMTEVVYNLQQDNQLRFASTSAVPALLSASLIHLVDARSTKRDVRNVSIGRFYQCWQALQYLQDMYACAEHAVWLLEAVIQKTKVQIPMLNLAPWPTGTRPPFKPKRQQSQILESAGQRASVANSVSTPLVSRNELLDAVHQPAVENNSRTVNNPCLASTQGPFPATEMEDSINFDLFSDTWPGVNVEDNLLQALVNFDMPNLFPNMGVRHRGVTSSPSSGNVRWVGEDPGHDDHWR
ncbi:fungal-specific transcription factor domain-containing protein [Ilyonectria sp. MPI-CAGE-AT-0026]|nr:fungal-specific transcription factor domain-containing protein [Ilyonectria sp. MPI-CAGE-AT-0026]